MRALARASASRRDVVAQHRAPCRAVGASRPHSMRMVVDLPGAVRPEEAEDLALRAPSKLDVVDRDEVAEAAGEVFDDDCVCHGSLVPGFRLPGLKPRPTVLAMPGLLARCSAGLQACLSRPTVQELGSGALRRVSRWPMRASARARPRADPAARRAGPSWWPHLRRSAPARRDVPRLRW